MVREVLLPFFVICSLTMAVCLASVEEGFGDFHLFGREGGLDVAVGSDGFVLSVAGLRRFQSVDVLAHQIALDAVASKKCE